MRRAALLVAVGLVLGLPSVAAPQERAPREAPAGPRAELRNLEDDRGATFAVSGPAGELPEGTSLHVTLAVDGERDLPIEAAFFRVFVRDGRYEARETFERRLAPAAYVGRVEVLMSEQSAAVARVLKQKFSFSPEHREVVAATPLVIGTREEQETFRRETLVALRAFLVGLQGLHGRVTTSAGTTREAFAAARAGFYEELRASVAELKALGNRHVVSPEQNLIGQVQGVHNELTRYIKAHPGAPARDLERVGHFLVTLLAGIDARLRT